MTDIDQARMGVAVLIDHETCLNYLGLRCDVCYRVCPSSTRPLPRAATQPRTRQARHVPAHGAQRSLYRLRQGASTPACWRRRPSGWYLAGLAKGELGHHYRLGWEEKEKGSQTSSVSDHPPTRKPEGL